MDSKNFAPRFGAPLQDVTKDTHLRLKRFEKARTGIEADFPDISGFGKVLLP